MCQYRRYEYHAFQNIPGVTIPLTNPWFKPEKSVDFVSLIFVLLVNRLPTMLSGRLAIAPALKCFEADIRPIKSSSPIRESWMSYSEAHTSLDSQLYCIVSLSLQVLTLTMEIPDARQLGSCQPPPREPLTSPSPDHIGMPSTPWLPLKLVYARFYRCRVLVTISFPYR